MTTRLRLALGHVVTWCCVSTAGAGPHQPLLRGVRGEHSAAQPDEDGQEHQDQGKVWFLRPGEVVVPKTRVGCDSYNQGRVWFLRTGRVWFLRTGYCVVSKNWVGWGS